ncbi:MAG: arsenate reductase ArsC [Dehalococcoidia bacterium]
MAADSLSRIDVELLKHRRALADEFEGRFSVETIERFLHESLDLLPNRPKVPTFMPLLAYRFARERLLAVAQSEGVTAKTAPEVLFVCVQNAGRSQMAAGLLKLESEGRVNVRTAGSMPADQIHEPVVEVMAELGLDLSEEFPKPLTDEFVRAADVVITMGCGDACPIYPGKVYRDWDVEDPAGKSIEGVRRIRDDIRGRVKALLGELVTAVP